MDALAAVAASADRETASDHFRHDPQFDAVGAETRAVMQSRVNSAVRDKYETENIKFMLYLYDHRENYGALVKPALLAELGPQHDRDRRGEPQPVTNASCAITSATPVGSGSAGLIRTGPPLTRSSSRTCSSRSTPATSTASRKWRGNAQEAAP